MDPRTLRSIRLKYEIWPWGPKCDTVAAIVNVTTLTVVNDAAAALISVSKIAS